MNGGIHTWPGGFHRDVALAHICRCCGRRFCWFTIRSAFRYQGPDDASHLVAGPPITSMGGLRSSIRASHGSTVELLRFAQRTAALGPRINSRLYLLDAW